MYLLKSISYDPNIKSVLVEDGIKCYIKRDNVVYVPDSFWGETEIYLGINASKQFEYYEEKYLLQYSNEYSVTPLEDNFKKLDFNVIEYEENIEGYIIFVKYGEDIKTNGEKLFGRYYNEIVVVLKDKEFLEFCGKRIEVIKNRLYLLI